MVFCLYFVFWLLPIQKFKFFCCFKLYLPAIIPFSLTLVRLYLPLFFLIFTLINSCFNSSNMKKNHAIISNQRLGLVWDRTFAQKHKQYKNNCLSKMIGTIIVVNVLWQRIMEPINVRYEKKPIILNITIKALPKA